MFSIELDDHFHFFYFTLVNKYKFPCCISQVFYNLMKPLGVGYLRTNLIVKYLLSVNHNVPTPIISVGRRQKS